MVCDCWSSGSRFPVPQKLTKKINMFSWYIFKNRPIGLVSLMLLLLLGSAQSTWCFQTSPDIEPIDTMLSDCRDAVPAACLSSEQIFKSQNSTPIPSDCKSCLDLSFEELVTTGIKSQGVDFVFIPAVEHPCTSIIFFPKVLTLLPSSPLPDRIFRRSLNIHRSIDSTILII